MSEKISLPHSVKEGIESKGTGLVWDIEPLSDFFA